MSTKIYNVEFPAWLNDSRTVEQLLVRVVLAISYRKRNRTHMSYALIPDGYSLKKVTKAQKQALNDKRRHDNVVALINNPEIIKQVIVVITGYLALKEANDLYEYLAEQGINITQDTKDAYTKKRQFGDAPVGVSIEQLVEATFERFGL